MSGLPCPKKDIDKCNEPMPSYSVLPAPCSAPDCTFEAGHEHHVVPKWFTRKWGERDWAVLRGKVMPIKVPVCFGCHQDLTDNQANLVYTGDDGPVFLWTVHIGSQTWEVLGEVPIVFPEGVKAERDLPRADLTFPAPSGNIEPGTDCPTCNRRVPHPKKQSSPVTRTKSFRVPADEYDAFVENQTQVQKIVGVYEQPFADFKAILAGQVLVLQHADEVRDHFQRSAA